jgi:hypothetical protein
VTLWLRRFIPDRDNVDLSTSYQMLGDQHSPARARTKRKVEKIEIDSSKGEPLHGHARTSA